MLPSSLLGVWAVIGASSKAKRRELLTFSVPGYSCWPVSFSVGHQTICFWAYKLAVSRSLLAMFLGQLHNASKMCSKICQKLFNKNVFRFFSFLFGFVICLPHTVAHTRTVLSFSFYSLNGQLISPLAVWAWLRA